MNNHDIIGSALQKYYSALKSLDDFALVGDFYDDISNLDKFFSEFRNITFVIQKGLRTNENKEKYKIIRDEYLQGDTLRWFVNTRNKTTKEKPFELTKELVVDVYLPGQMVTFQNERMVVDFESSFDDVLDYIQSVVFDELELIETFFTIHIVFKEAGNPLDLYPTIKKGLIQMNEFINKMASEFPCECDKCSSLTKKTKELFDRVQSKELLFTRDYSMDYQKNVQSGTIAGLFVKQGNVLHDSFLDMRIPLERTAPFKGKSGSVEEVFNAFIRMLITIFRLSDRQIMPTFMIVYNDNTFRIGSFIASSKATFYRKENEIVKLPDFSEAVSVFCCNENYAYDLKNLREIDRLPYDKRIMKSNKELLSFTHITNNQKQVSADFDISHIYDNEYVANVINSMKITGYEKVAPFDWLNPIRFSLN